MVKDRLKIVNSCLESIIEKAGNSFDLLAGQTIVEKTIELAILGVPCGPAARTELLTGLVNNLEEVKTSDLNVVVFGGGTGLSTIVGGDSCDPDWPRAPFRGLKSLFPKTKAIVCATDDGGSTGELLKDLPLVGLGDLRHVLLSAISKSILIKKYRFKNSDCDHFANSLFRLFNFRFNTRPASPAELLASTGLDLSALPSFFRLEIVKLVEFLFSNPTLLPVLERPQCLGNLLLVAAIYRFVENGSPDSLAFRKGINFISGLIGVDDDTVMVSTTTPCQLKLMYSNGALVTGESKSALARRGYPVDQGYLEFAGEAEVPKEVFAAIKNADIFIWAPGSLYTSVIPVLQVPGLVDAVRENKEALKILVANIWDQTGETDIARDDPSRRYYVSDLIKAYHRNIPAGVNNLFKIIMTLGLQDISGGIIQNYAVEGKSPIYLDRENVLKMGFTPVEANIFSNMALQHGHLKHDPASFAKAVKAVWSAKKFIDKADAEVRMSNSERPYQFFAGEVPCIRYQKVCAKLKSLEIIEFKRLADIFWRHQDILPAHLDYINGIKLIEVDNWKRCQEWDNVFSFYDPADRFIKIRRDMVDNDQNFEIAFLVALGQSLLGNYALEKTMRPLNVDGDFLGRIYQFVLRPADKLNSFFSIDELEEYLSLAKMVKLKKRERTFTRLLNGSEGFTPPGMLFGLIYVWYLENQFASHIEYKMGIARMPVSNLVPEQIKTLKRRSATIRFFRNVVFRNALRGWGNRSL